MAIQPKNTAEIKVDTISEKSAASGVTADGVLLKDGDVEADEVRADSLIEKTSSNGIAIEAVSFRDGAMNWGGTSGGTANAQTITLTPAPAAYYTGMEIKFIPGNTSTSATVTLNVNGLGAKSVKTTLGNDLQLGNLDANGSIAHVVYDGTNFVLLNPALRFDSSSWTPTLGAQTGMTYTGTSSAIAFFSKEGRVVHFTVHGTGTTGGIAGTYLTCTLPVTISGSYGTSTGLGAVTAYVKDVGNPAEAGVGLLYDTGGGQLLVYRSGIADFSLGANTSFWASGFYFSDS